MSVSASCAAVSSLPWRKLRAGGGGAAIAAIGAAGDGPAALAPPLPAAATQLRQGMYAAQLPSQLHLVGRHAQCRGRRRLQLPQRGLVPHPGRRGGDRRRASTSNTSSVCDHAYESGSTRCGRAGIGGCCSGPGLRSARCGAHRTSTVRGGHSSPLRSVTNICGWRRKVWVGEGLREGKLGSSGADGATCRRQVFVQREVAGACVTAAALPGFPGPLRMRLRSSEGGSARHRREARRRCRERVPLRGPVLTATARLPMSAAAPRTASVQAV
jgi:hypothetical protein